MAIFFTADPHFGHANIIKHCNRPFDYVEEMDQNIITNFNRRVSPHDTLYCIGDWCAWRGASAGEIAKHYRKRLVAGKVILIWGNHDKKGRKDPLFVKQFDSVHDMLEVNIDEQLFVLCHYAMRVWNKSHHGSFHLYGHSHGSLPDDPHARAIDVGVDCFNFSPVSVPEVFSLMEKKQWKPVDRHGS